MAASNNNKYYIAPTCTSNGKGIVLGTFTDEYCSEKADSSTVDSLFYSTYGFKMPYSYTSMVNSACVSCKDSDNGDVNDLCDNVYQSSGKCESKLNGSIYYPNTSGCTFINTLGSKSDAYVVKKSSAPFFAWFFFLSTLGLGGYAYTLYSKKEPKIDLASTGAMA